MAHFAPDLLALYSGLGGTTCSGLSTLIIDNTNLFDLKQSGLNELSPVLDISIFKITENLPPNFAIIFSCAVLILVVVGVYPRITGILHLWIILSFNMSGTILEGGDQVHQMMAIFLLPITLVDSRRSHWQYKDFKFSNNIYIMYMLLLVVIIGKLQISFIYLVAGISKLNEPFWQSGTALYYILDNPVFGTYNFVLDILHPILKNPVGVSILTYGSIAVEFTIGVSLFLSKDRQMKLILFMLGVTLHIFIGLFMGLISFSIVMISSLLFYFYILNKTNLNNITAH